LLGLRGEPPWRRFSNRAAASNSARSRRMTIAGCENLVSSAASAKPSRPPLPEPVDTGELVVQLNEARGEAPERGRAPPAPASPVTLCRIDRPCGGPEAPGHRST
jgi:hypothetical protein